MLRFIRNAIGAHMCSSGAEVDTSASSLSNQVMKMSSKDKQAMEGIVQVIRKNADNWPSELVALKEFNKFSGGVYNNRTVANAISKGDGPQGAFKIGRATVLPKSSCVDWMINRAGRR